MEYKTSNTRIASAYFVGLLQIFFGCVIALSCAAMTLGNAVFGGHVRNFALVLWFVGTIAGCLMLSSGLRQFKLVGNFKRLMRIMGSRSRIALSTVSAMTNKGLGKTVWELKQYAERGYCPKAYVDLSRREFVLYDDGPPLPVEVGPTVLEEKKKSPALPVYLLGLTWILYALSFPMYRWYDFIIAAVLSILVYAIATRLTPSKTKVIEVPRKVQPEPKPAKIETGNSELDEVLTQATGYIGQMTELDAAITEPRINLPVKQLLDISKQIIEFIRRSPEKIRKTRQFINYYLPTTINLLKNYEELSREKHKGPNIHSAMKKIEDTMQTIVEAFKKELDNLYQDKAMDISVDIDVMKSMMQNEGLSGDVRELLNKQAE